MHPYTFVRVLAFNMHIMVASREDIGDKLISGIWSSRWISYSRHDWFEAGQSAFVIYTHGLKSGISFQMLLISNSKLIDEDTKAKLLKDNG